VERDGILRSRDEAHGGPLHLYGCPACGRSNHCERSKRGRWFASPPFQPNFLEYLLGAFAAQPGDFLRAAAWYKENGERRRYFFERDGDRRYSSGGWWRRWLRPAASSSAESSSERDGGADDGARWEDAGSERRDHRRDRSRRERGAAERPTARSFISPWELLGLDEGADESTIRRAFHRLAVQYHPDKVHHLGDEFQRVAHERFKELQRAYETLLRRARRGGS